MTTTHSKRITHRLLDSLIIEYMPVSHSDNFTQRQVNSSTIEYIDNQTHDSWIQRQLHIMTNELIDHWSHCQFYGRQLNTLLVDVLFLSNLSLLIHIPTRLANWPIYLNAQQSNTATIAHSYKWINTILKQSQNNPRKSTHYTPIPHKQKENTS